jgi:hypothetical protein
MKGRKEGHHAARAGRPFVDSSLVLVSSLPELRFT